jgi:hypothetical protein
MDQLGSQNRPQETVNTEPKLALDAPLGAVAFLHATVDTTSVVVGQQVTVSIYLYVDANARDPGMVEVHEATAPDFVKKVLFEEDDEHHRIYRADVGGRVFNVRLLRTWALFPLTAGDLAISPMELTLQRTRATGEPGRKSELLTIHVAEPPMAHRPAGYLVGDVGKFALSADVSPRDIEEDSAVGVTLTLQGAGNLPSMITPPAQAGIEWLPPDVHDRVGPMKDDRFGGSRTFAYVVRLHKTGDVRLGSIRIPFWDPTLRRYDVAAADLGVVTVRPSAAPKPAADTPPDPFAMLPEARTRPGGTKAPASRFAEARPGTFWAAMGAAPLSFAAFAFVSWLVRAARDRAARVAASPLTELRARVSAAARAARNDDARALSAATARVLEVATIVYADVNVRDARGGEAGRRLVDAGVAEDTAGTIDSVLADCEAARFSPEAPELSVARERWALAQTTIVALRRGA